MRMKRICLTLLLLGLMGSLASADEPHIHSFGGSSKDLPLDAIVLRDGVFLFVGSTFSNDGDVSYRYNTSKDYCDAWAICLDRYHNIRYPVLVGDSNTAYEKFVTAAPLSDGGFALFYEYIDDQEHKFELMRYNHFGELQDIVAVPEGTTSVHVLDDGFIAAGGFREYYADANETQMPWLARLTFDGSTLWRHTYPDLTPWSLLDLKQDGDLLFCSGMWRESFEYSGNILCMDAKGNVLWNYITDPKGFATLDKVTPMGDGGAVAVGWKSGPDEDDGGLAVRVDGAGQLMWTNTVYRPDSAWFTDVLRMGDGVMVSGMQMYEEDEKLFTSGWIAQLDAKGQIIQELGRERLLGMGSSVLVRGTDSFPYYISCGGTYTGAEDFFMMRVGSTFAAVDEANALGDAVSDHAVTDNAASNSAEALDGQNGLDRLVDSDEFVNVEAFE